MWHLIKFSHLSWPYPLVVSILTWVVRRHKLDQFIFKAILNHHAILFIDQTEIICCRFLEIIHILFTIRSSLLVKFYGESLFEYCRVYTVLFSFIEISQFISQDWGKSYHGLPVMCWTLTYNILSHIKPLLGRYSPVVQK